MKYVISVSTFAKSSDEFRSEIQKLLGEECVVRSLEWQLKGGPQKLMDMLDTRDGQQVIIEVANKLVKFIDEARELDQDVVIISQKAGSRIVEEALIMVKGIDQIEIELKHVMLAPLIGGSDWKSIGKYAASVLMMGAAGIAALASNSKKGKAAALLGAIGSVALNRRESVSDRLEIDENSEEERINFTNIKRVILYNPEDSSFDLLTQNLSEGKFFKGIYPIDKIVSLKEEDLDQEYRRNKLLGTETMTKREILKKL